MRTLLLLAACLAAAAQTLPHFGVAVGASSLGAEVQAATAVTKHSNVRVGFNYFSYSHGFQKDGIAYQGKLGLRSGEALYDQYLLGGLHISPGVMFLGANGISGSASVPRGQSFTLGGATYYSDATTAVTGSGAVNLSKTAPMVLLGLGNLLPRNERRFTVNFEVGAVFQAPIAAALALGGSACTGKGTGCQSIATSSILQASVQSEQAKINSALSFLKYYPLVSLTFGYRF